MAKNFPKKYVNKGWAFDYPVSAILSGCLSIPDTTSLHHYLKNKQQKLIFCQW